MSWFTQRTKHPNTNGVVLCMQCSEECADLHRGETQKQLHKRMAQHMRATSSGQYSAVHLHLKEKGHWLLGQWWSHSGQRRQMVWERSKGSHIKSILNWKNHLWTEEVVSGITFPAPTMQHCLSPGSFTTIHTDAVTKTHPFRQVDNSEVIMT